MHSLGPDPGITDILCLPAEMIRNADFLCLVLDGHLKHVVLLEYVLINPQEAAHLLIRLENSPRFAICLFCMHPKARSFSNELCEFLGYFPTRPEGWVNQYPPLTQVDRMERLERIDRSLLATSVQDVQAIEAHMEQRAIESIPSTSSATSRQGPLDKFLHRRPRA
jgi:hypothetical protein